MRNSVNFWPTILQVRQFLISDLSLQFFFHIFLGFGLGFVEIFVSFGLIKIVLVCDFENPLRIPATVSIPCNDKMLRPHHPTYVLAAVPVEM